MNIFQAPMYILKDITAEDQQFIFEGLSDPAVIRFYGVNYKTFEETSGQIEFYRNLEQNKTGKWWKITNENGVNVGACGFNYYQLQHKKIELGYWLLPAYWGKGIMSEVLPKAIKAIQLLYDIHRIEAMVETGNDSSSKLLKRSGFEYEGTMKECEWKQDKWISLEVYALLL
jgi:ribosomal-protein-alanine N-acetyltransferase